VNCPICSWSPDNPEYLPLLETQYWRICLAPNQSLLGRCVIHLKRHTGDLANLSEEELLEFLSVVKKVEASVKLAFGSTMFNWSCYMNYSYRESPPDPHIHWWAVPRYDHTVNFCDTRFDDPHFGNPYDHHRVMNASKELRLKIAEEIKNHLLPALGHERKE
jgi:diadenosine tetraphosphate (Ap4A) HIT family hydrolase